MSSKSKKDIIYSLFPESLSSNRDYKAFIEILANEYDYTSGLLELFPNITQVSHTPEEFLQYLAYIVNYRVLDSERAEVQRDIVKRIFSAYAKRGSESSLKKSAARANDPNWYREDLTYYHGLAKEEPLSITYPQYQLFTWSKSHYSKEDRYPGSDYWTDGVVIFNMSNMTQATKDAIERVIPAGRKYYFNNSIWIVGDDSELLQYLYTIHDWQAIHYDLNIIDKEAGLVWSSPTGGIWNSDKWSGSIKSLNYIDIHKNLSASFLPNFSELDNKYSLFSRPKSDSWSIFDNSTNHDLSDLSEMSEFKAVVRPLGTKKWSKDFRWGDRSTWSGSNTGIIDLYVEIPILPSDNSYPVSDVLDLKYHDFGKTSTVSDVEVTIKRLDYNIIDSNNNNSISIDSNDSSTRYVIINQDNESPIVPTKPKFELATWNKSKYGDKNSRYPGTNYWDYDY